MTDWNMPPGTNVHMIPGYDAPDYWTPDIRCPVCGIFVAYSWAKEPKNFRKAETIQDTRECQGGFKANCDDVPYYMWSEETSLEQALKDHPPHTWTDYGGVVTTYECPQCHYNIEYKEF